MNRLLQCIDRLSQLAETLAVLSIYGYCALMLAEVFARSQAKSFSFSWEFSQYAMAGIFALAAGPAIRTGVHVRITLLSDYLPRSAAKWLDIIANIMALVVAALLVSGMWVKFGKSYDRNIVATTVSETPLWIPQLFVLWGMAQLWLDLAARLVRRIQNKPYEWRNADNDAGEPLVDNRSHAETNHA